MTKQNVVCAVMLTVRQQVCQGPGRHFCPAPSMAPLGLDGEAALSGGSDQSVAQQPLVLPSKPLFKVSVPVGPGPLWAAQGPPRQAAQTARGLGSRDGVTEARWVRAGAITVRGFGCLDRCCRRGSHGPICEISVTSVTVLSSRSTPFHLRVRDGVTGVTGLWGKALLAGAATFCGGLVKIWGVVRSASLPSLPSPSLPAPACSRPGRSARRV